MKISISIFLLGISSLASASVINTCIDAEGKKITTDQACETLALKDAGAASLPLTIPAASPASNPAAASASTAGEGAEAFMMAPMPKVAVEKKLPPIPPPSRWAELLHDDYSVLLLMAACPFLFAFFWYVFEYRMRRN